MKLRFKQGIYGIIFDLNYGNITEVTNPITDDAKQLFDNNRIMALFTDVETIIDCFNIETEEDVTEKWSDILEIVK